MESIANYNNTLFSNEVTATAFAPITIDVSDDTSVNSDEQAGSYEFAQACKDTYSFEHPTAVDAVTFARLTGTL